MTFIWRRWGKPQVSPKLKPETLSFEQICIMILFGLDPNDWSVAHVRLWLQWAVRQFNLVGLRLSDWNITGKELCQLSLSDFHSKVPVDPEDLFWTHLELLRKCKFVGEFLSAPWGRQNAEFILSHYTFVGSVHT